MSLYCSYAFSMACECYMLNLSCVGEPSASLFVSFFFPGSRCASIINYEWDFMSADHRCLLASYFGVLPLYAWL